MYIYVPGPFPRLGLFTPLLRNGSRRLTLSFLSDVMERDWNKVCMDYTGHISTSKEFSCSIDGAVNRLFRSHTRLGKGNIRYILRKGDGEKRRPCYDT